jgi:hypothetical protein
VRARTRRQRGHRYTRQFACLKALIKQIRALYTLTFTGNQPVHAPALGPGGARAWPRLRDRTDRARGLTDRAGRRPAADLRLKA